MRARSLRSISPFAAAARLGLGALVVAGLVLNLSNLVGLLAYVPYATVGSLLVVRRPRHVVGWLLLLMAVAFTFLGRPIEVILWATRTGNEAWLGAVAWFGTMLSFVLFGGMATLAAVFPTGALPGGAIGRSTRAALALIAAIALMQAFDPSFSTIMPDGTTVVIQSPIGIAREWSGWTFLDGPAYLLVVGGLVVCILGLVVRFRRATGIERLQDKWLLAALACVPVGVCFGFAGVLLFDPLGAWAWSLALLSFPLPAIAVGIAIMRFRLYDIDRIVSRTISYGIISATLLAAYAALILVLQGPLGDVTGGNTVAVAASTLAVAALFQPVRRGTQAAVDRRFNRARYDSERTLAALAARLREEMDLPFVSAAIVHAAVQSVEPASASMWLRLPRTR